MIRFIGRAKSKKPRTNKAQANKSGENQRINIQLQNVYAVQYVLKPFVSVAKNVEDQIRESIVQRSYLNAAALLKHGPRLRPGLLK